MWFSLVIQIIIIFSLGFCQDVNELKLDQVGQLLNIAKNLEAKIEGLDGKMASMDYRMTSMNGRIALMVDLMALLDDRMTSQDDWMTGMDENMNELKQQVSSIQENVLLKIEEQNCASEQQGLSNLDQLYQTFTDIFAGELDFQREISRTTCSRSQVESLQTLLATDECLEGSHNCSSESSCSDLTIGFRCTCNVGYEGDGVTCQEAECFPGRKNCSIHALCSNVEGHHQCICLPGFKNNGSTCIDVDECNNGNSQCHKDADCINNDGSFTCSCKHGYAGDGFSCVASPCDSPFYNFKELGCVTLVDDETTWENSQENCRTLGGRLLEGIESLQHLDQLKQQFGQVYPWIGMRDLKWVTGGDPIDPESPLWKSSEPDQGIEECVDACLGCDPPRLYDVTCGQSRRSLCQLN